MNFGMLRAAVGVFLVAMLALSLACGSSKSSSGSSKQTFDPKQADAEAHAALLKEDYLGLVRVDTARAWPVSIS